MQIKLLFILLSLVLLTLANKLAYIDGLLENLLALALYLFYLASWGFMVFKRKKIAYLNALHIDGFELSIVYLPGLVFVFYGGGFDFFQGFFPILIESISSSYGLQRTFLFIFLPFLILGIILPKFFSFFKSSFGRFLLCLLAGFGITYGLLQGDLQNWHRLFNFPDRSLQIYVLFYALVNMVLLITWQSRRKALH